MEQDGFTVFIGSMVELSLFSYRKSGSFGFFYLYYLCIYTIIEIEMRRTSELNKRYKGL